MNSYDPRTNRRITAHYNNEISLWKNVQNKDRAEEIFWFWIAELLSFCFNLVGEMPSSYMSDCMGVISRKIVETPPCDGIEKAVMDLNPVYKDYQAKFGITDIYDDCGEFYKELNESDDEYLKEQIVLIMSDYIKFVAPFAIKEAKKWMSVYRSEAITEEGWMVIETRYKYYLENYKSLIKRLKK